MVGDATTLHGCLEMQARADPERMAALFVDADGEVVDRLTFGQWWARVSRVAAGLAHAFPDASRVMLLFEPGLDFQVALFACFLAGRIAIPAYPPDMRRVERTVPRLRHMVADAGVDVILGGRDMAQAARPFGAGIPELNRPAWACLDELEKTDGDGLDAVSDPSAVAMIQYTSGSTRRPRGVVLTHANIVANVHMMRMAASFDETRRIVSWLPTYHDMGLAVAIFLPAVCGCRCYQLSAVDFLRRPMLWLQVIQAYRATDTAVPTFALELTVRRALPTELHELDLGSLQTCLVGAEPVRYDAVHRFVRVFGRAGLRASTMYPGYGLAEAVLAVASPPWQRGIRTLALDAGELAAGRVREVDPESKAASRVVSMGRPLAGMALRIVGPADGTPLDEGRVGEIWIAGPSVAGGYLGKGNDDVFGNVLQGVPGAWLRSGDLGFLHGGELYVTGRLKDLIVVRGRNHYPQDIEATVERADPSVRHGGVVAFSVPHTEGERLVVVAESSDESRERLREARQAIRVAVRAVHGLAADVALIRPGTIDKTSSGKVARQACRKRYLDGELALLDPPGRSGDTADALVGILADLRAVFHGSLPEGLHGATRLDTLALDSLGIMDLAGRIETRTGVKLPVTAMIEGLLLGDLANLLVNERRPSPIDAQADGRRSLSLTPSAKQAPLFCVGGMGGAALYLRELAAACAPLPMVALQPPGLFPGEVPMGSVEEIAASFVEEVLRIQPGGSYVIAGHSFGGVVAFEMARQLVASGREVDQLMLLDTVRIRRLGDQEDDADERRFVAHEVRKVLDRVVTNDAAAWPGESSLDRVIEVYRRSFRAMLAYRPVPYAGKVTLFRAVEPFPQDTLHPERRVQAGFDLRDLGWGESCPRLDVVDVPGDHFSLVLGERAVSLARSMTARASHARALPGQAATLARNAVRALEIDGANVRFDAFHPLLMSQGPAIFRQLREASPIYRDASGVWWIFRHADVSACLKDKRLSVDPRNASPVGARGVTLGDGGLKPSLVSAWIRRQEGLPLTTLYNHAMVFLDPPRHDVMRKAFAPMLAADAMARWRPKVVERAERLVQAMAERDAPDIVRDVALPLPVNVIMDLLDIPQADGAIVHAWAHEVFVGLDPLLHATRAHEVARAAEDFLAYIGEHLERSRGRDDGSLMAHLARLDASGGLTRNDIVANIIFLFVAGFETTLGGIGNAMAALFDHPAQWDLLRSHPDRIDGAIDELLRFDGPLRLVIRVALDDVDLAGRTIPKGDTLVLNLASANRDPAVFADPDVLDLDRDARGHVAFSHGAHYCIGAPLARMEMAAALTALARLDIEPMPGGAAWRESYLFHGHERFGVRIGRRP